MICHFMPIFSVAIAIIIAQLQKLGKNILAAYARYTREKDRQWCEQVDGRLSIRAPTVTTLPSNISRSSTTALRAYLNIELD